MKGTKSRENPFDRRKPNGKKKFISQNEINSDNNVEPLCNLYDCNIASYFFSHSTAWQGAFDIAIQMKMSRPNGQFILHNNGAEAIKRVVDNSVGCIHANHGLLNASCPLRRLLQIVSSSSSILESKWEY